MLIEQYLAVRNDTEKLCQPLAIEDYVPQAADFTSPPKWHLAHTTWFFERLILKQNLADYPEFNPDFDHLFNSYYQSLGRPALRTHRGLYTRPSVAEVMAYRRHVDTQMMRLLNSGHSEQINQLVIIGINHEQQHQELLITDLKYLFALNPTLPVYDPNYCLVDDVNPPHTKAWLTIPAGLHTIGHAGDGFCYDNEQGRHQVWLEEFAIATTLVTNAEYLEFIQAGGYQQTQYWLDDGWQWRTSNNVNHPLYWHHRDGHWYQYTLAGLQPLQADAMLAHISFYEANAFAKWRQARLPTEFEWEAACDQLNWGKRWEWTASSYLPYPKFKASDGALSEYNGKFMVNQMVLRGASSATPKSHQRHTYRNFFHPHLQWQVSGIRLVKDNE